MRKLSNPSSFFTAVRSTLFGGHLSSEQVQGCEAVLKACGDADWPVAWTAYGLATGFHETNATMEPVREAYWLSDAARKAYCHRMYDIDGERPQVAHALGNAVPGDGFAFHGRGYVQLTGRANYAKAAKAIGASLIDNPDLAMQPDIAARILVKGMSEGWFTGAKLARYLPGPAGTPAQFSEARRIINGTDKAAKIAGEAMCFQVALQSGNWS